MEQTLHAINLRYSNLAESCCSLSCGGAINHSGPKVGEVCVDLGSGRGNDVIRLAEQVGPSGKVWGVDASEGMIAKARMALQKFNITNAEIVQAELEALPMADKSVDLVISNCTINHAQDKAKVWSEIYRILRKGGRFVVSDIYSLQVVPDECRTDPNAVAECWAGSVTREEYLTQLTDAGFCDVKIIEESAPYAKGQIQVASWTIAAQRTRCCN